MASTLTVAGTTVWGNKRITYGTGNLGTYAANGIAVTAAQCGLKALEFLYVGNVGGYVMEWDKANGKVKVYLDATPAASAALPELGAVDISTSTLNWLAIGT